MRSKLNSTDRLIVIRYAISKVMLGIWFLSTLELLEKNTSKLYQEINDKKTRNIKIDFESFNIN